MRSKKENDIKNIPVEELPQLAGEIRTFLLEHLSRTGGHLASNLGAVRTDHGPSLCVPAS